jgi:alpha-1,3-rhamnosyl/mannosyltransferase
LLRFLPEAGCTPQPYSWPRLGADASAISVGQPMPQSFEAASLVELLTPRAHRIHMPADLFHVTDYRVVRMDCPVVATLHDALPIKYPEWCNPRLRGLKNWMQRKAAQKADHVIALSHFAIDELVECFGVDERRVSVVPCGVDDEWLEAPDPQAVAATLAANGLRPGYFLFVGTLQPRKNIGRLIEAWQALPAAVRAERQLVIVGSAGWRCEELLRQIQAAQSGGDQLVWLSGLHDVTDLRHVYAGAGVFVFPSLYEGFGIPCSKRSHRRCRWWRPIPARCPRCRPAPRLRSTRSTWARWPMPCWRWCARARCASAASTPAARAPNNSPGTRPRAKRPPCTAPSFHTKPSQPCASSISTRLIIRTRSAVSSR